MIISHDLGTTGNKATLVSGAGELVASVTMRYGADFGLDGRAEQHPLDWWQAMCQANVALIERTGILPRNIQAISFSGQMMGVVPIDGQGDVVRPAMIWADTRSQRQAQVLIERVGMKRGYAITGHRLNPTYSLPKLMWLRDNEPDAFARIDAMLQAKDYLAYRLTGVRATDPSDASSTNAFDQSTGDWSDELLAAAEVDRTLFPEIVASTAVVGTVTAQAARETGLLEGTPVVMGGGDGPMAALGAGIIDEGSGAYAYLGSSSWVSVSSTRPLHDPLMRSMTFNHVIPDAFVPTATMQAGGASLQWITEVLSPTAEERYAELLTDAASVEAAAEGLYFLPHLLGERSPYWNPQARGAFVGLHMHHGRGHMTRAVLEGVAFNLHTGLRAFSENGIDVGSIDAIGGAANSELLLQIFADVWGADVSRRSLVDEAGAIGAAVVAGVGVGVFAGFDATLQFSERTDARRPAAERHVASEAQYLEFLDAYTRLEPWFDAVAEARRR